MSKIKYKFDLNLMGKKVLVTQVLERKYEDTKRTWEPVNVIERRVGWIIGHSFVCNGTYIRGFHYGNQYMGGEYGYEPPSLKVKEKIPCLLVTFWPNQKPIKIPINGYLDLTETELSLYPLYSNAGYGEGIERRRQIAQFSNFIQDVPRDAKGRFK